VPSDKQKGRVRDTDRPFTFYEAVFSLTRFYDQLQTRWLGRPLIYEPVVGSTMDVARTLAREGAAHGTIVLAEEQLLGRGRLGRRWFSPSGVNLYLSILLRPSLVELRTLAMLAPLAIAEGAGAEAGVDCAIKWPNDVQARGRKLAGVLLESELSGDRPLFAIAGLGINVNYDVAGEPEIAEIATSLLRETGTLREREAVLAACLAAFERGYEQAPATVYARWHARLNTLGRRIRVTYAGQSLEGLAEDVAPDGSLILLQDGGVRVELPAGEVSLRE
jgi:BirA family biotin operon repressor/biotin-[acetyl-CoA-carboxylase] ligase